MTDKIKGILIAAAAMAVLAIGGVAFASASGDGAKPAQEVDTSEPAAEAETGAEPGEAAESEAAERATGSRADAAGRAARDAVGGGRVVAVEHADGGVRGFEVEVQRTDGSYVEVNLDEHLNVVSTGSDD